ncbi:hypothetical protein BST61_g10188 [Cercospora zeina]
MAIERAQKTRSAPPLVTDQTSSHLLFSSSVPAPHHDFQASSPRSRLHGSTLRLHVARCRTATNAPSTPSTTIAFTCTRVTVNRLREDIQRRRAVETSELIQQYLFFQPIPRPFEKRNPVSNLEYSRHDHERTDSETWTSALTLENPWLYLLSDNIEQSKRLHRYHQASWKRMLPTQPAKANAAGRYLLLQDVATRSSQRHVWWHTWTPVFCFDTLQQAKKLWRLDETFVELELGSREARARATSDTYLVNNKSLMIVDQMPSFAFFNEAIPSTQDWTYRSGTLHSLRYEPMVICANVGLNQRDAKVSCQGHRPLRQLCQSRVSYWIQKRFYVIGGRQTKIPKLFER